MNRWQDSSAAAARADLIMAALARSGTNSLGRAISGRKITGFRMPLIVLCLIPDTGIQPEACAPNV